MRILYLTFYFDPDLCPGSFRNTALVNELSTQLSPNDSIHVITTQPNRYQSYKPSAPGHEKRGNITIDRVDVPTHASGLFDQIRSFTTYYWAAHRIVKNQSYDLVVASSSRLFTAFLGARIARKQGIPLVLDVRDLFRETILEMLPNPFAQLSLKPVLWAVERYSFGYATHINSVSEGFRPYLASFKQATYSYFTNGIDDEFLALSLTSVHQASSTKTLLYAGNIGEGQGLHKIIPQAARQLGNDYCFIIIGAGGATDKLVGRMRAEGVTNVELRKPVSRKELIAEYQKADYLFVHLNDLQALTRVLPSKLFEYGATDKPIVAGVAGYAAHFIQTHLTNSILFAPGDVDSMVKQLRQTPYRTQIRTEFIQQFRRKKIMQEMARQIMKGIEQPVQSSELTTV